MLRGGQARDVALETVGEGHSVGARRPWCRSSQGPAPAPLGCASRCGGHAHTRRWARRLGRRARAPRGTAAVRTGARRIRRRRPSTARRRRRGRPPCAPPRPPGRRHGSGPAGCPPPSSIVTVTSAVARTPRCAVRQGGGLGEALHSLSCRSHRVPRHPETSVHRGRASTDARPRRGRNSDLMSESPTPEAHALAADAGLPVFGASCVASTMDVGHWKPRARRSPWRPVAARWTSWRSRDDPSPAATATRCRRRARSLRSRTRARRPPRRTSA